MYAIKAEVGDPRAREFAFRAADAAREHHRPAHRPGQAALCRKELRHFSAWDDGRPETELNFKFYRQATDKIVGLSEEAADFRGRYF
jgi:hypothetical protein